MKFNRFTLLMAAFPFVLYACGSDDSGGGGSGGKKDAGTDSGKDSGKGGTGGVGAVGGTGGGGLTGGTGGSTGGTGGGVAGAAGTGTGGVAGGGGTAGTATGGTAGAAGSATGGVAGAAGSASGGTAGVGPDASVGGSAGVGPDASVGGSGGTDGGTPTGDTCASAFVVGALPYVASGTTVGAGADYGYSAGACLPETDAAGAGAPDQVYAFTPAVSGKYLVSLSTTGFDSALYIATDCANIDTTCVVGDEDICSTCTESATITATAGTTYYIFVDGYQTTATTTGGAYTLQIDPIAAPTNDTCANATPITTLPFYQVNDTTTAASDYGFGANSCAGVSSATGSGANDLVYSFTPTTTGSYIVNVATTSFDAAIYIATDCAMINATCLGAADSCSTSCTETRSFSATAGTKYYIFVDGFETTPTPLNSGQYAISVTTPPPGDTCGNAIPVTSVPFSDTGNTSGATSDYGYSAGSCLPETDGWGAASNDVVYSFNPTVTGSYTISLGGNLDSTVYVVTNCADVDNTCVAGDEHCFSGGGCAETVTTNLTAGTTYYIIADGYGNTSNVAGPYTLDIIKNP